MNRKQRGFGGGGTPEVSSARSKLDGLLQTLVEKKDDSFDGTPIKEEPMEEELTPSSSIKRLGSSSGSRGSYKRKKRQIPEESNADVGQYHHTYVMKLFDRSLDLAQFNEDTPLYPICYEWMRNQPHSRNLGVKSRSSSPDLDDSFDEDSGDMPNVYNLPPPLPIKMERTGRIPSPIPVHDQPLDIYAPSSSAPQPEELLLDHLERWKQTRLKWKAVGFRHEERHSPSLKIIKDIYDYQVKDQ